MALLSDADRVEVTARWMRENDMETGLVTKADIRAFINAVDQWAEDNAVEYNLAIPLPARVQLNAAQKSRGLALVIEQRFRVV